MRFRAPIIPMAQMPGCERMVFQHQCANSEVQCLFWYGSPGIINPLSVSCIVSGNTVSPSHHSIINFLINFIIISVFGCSTAPA